MGDAQSAAETLGKKLIVLNARSERELDAAFASFVQAPVGAVLVAADPFFLAGENRSLRWRPTTHWPRSTLREFAAVGGLISYGTGLADAYHQAGVYTVGFSRAKSPPIFL